MLQKLAGATIADTSEPKVLLRYIGQHIGLRTKGHPGITRQDQVISLAPYLTYLAKYEVLELWAICNEHGWFDIRQRVLDPHLRQNGGILYVDEQLTFAALDGLASRRNYWLDHWLEGFAKTGASEEAQMSLIGKWLRERKTMAAMEIASEALNNIGRRTDLSLLDVPLIDANPGIEVLKANTTFAVCRRSLN